MRNPHLPGGFRVKEDGTMAYFMDPLQLAGWLLDPRIASQRFPRFFNYVRSVAPGSIVNELLGLADQLKREGTREKARADILSQRARAARAEKAKRWGNETQEQKAQRVFDRNNPVPKPGVKKPGERFFSYDD